MLTGIRSYAALQVATGACLLLRPDLVEAAPPWAVRALGGRVALQGMAQAVRPTRRLLLAGGAADALHALSMVALAALDDRRRAIALRSGAIAAVGAGVQAALAPSARR